MAKQEMYKIKIIKGTVCGGEIYKPNPKAEKAADRFPVVEATREDARLLILTGFAEPADEACRKMMKPARRR